MLSAKSFLIMAGKYKDFYPMYRNAMNKDSCIYENDYKRNTMGIYHGMSRSTNKIKKILSTQLPVCVCLTYVCFAIFFYKKK